MSGSRVAVGPITLALLLGLVRAPGNSLVVRQPIDLSASEIARDTPPSGAVQQPGQPSQQRAAPGPAVSRIEYEGWRQYSVYCARCHGQDALPNPVAANLLISLGPGGAVDSPEKFAGIVTAGRPASGMPSFKEGLSPAQIKAIYAYLKGRAEKRIPPGRPAAPAG
jgi:mono/diheme cytochrome c family protein